MLFTAIVVSPLPNLARFYSGPRSVEFLIALSAIIRETLPASTSQLGRRPAAVIVTVIEVALRHLLDSPRPRRTTKLRNAALNQVDERLAAVYVRRNSSDVTISSARL